MRYLVTGATGFIGAELARLLVDRGHEVVAYHRPESDLAALVEIRCDRRAGSLFSVDELAAAMRGCDGVFHVAGNTSWYRRDRAEVWRANVESTRVVLNAMKQARVRRGVLTSSVSAVGMTGDSERPADESVPHNWPKGIPYPSSKWAAEESWFKEADGVETVAVNPATVLGPGDVRRKFASLFRKIARGAFPRLECGGISVCDVRDVAIGHVQAFERGRSRERYILAAANVAYSTLAETIARAIGVDPPEKVARPFLIRGMAALLAGVEWVGVRPKVPAGYLWCMTRYIYHTAEKARRELGFAPRLFEETIHDSVQWYCSRGVLDRTGARVHSETGSP